MKNFLTLLLIFLGICSSVSAKNVRFIQVTDIHMTKNTVEQVQRFVQDVNANHSDVDFIVFSGDNIDRANPKDLDLFLDTIKPIKVKKYVLVGNHDLMKTQDMTSKYYMKQVKKKLGLYHSKKPNYVFKEGKLIFITMNGVKEVIPGPNGYYRKQELEWLDKKLTQYKDKKVVIIQHFPLFDSRTKGHSLYKKNEYLDVLKKHNNVIAIISGHYHENKEEIIDGIYQIATKNFAGNHYYKIIEINDNDGFIFTSLIEK